MKIGDYLYCIKDKKTDIYSEDEIVGTFEIKRHERFLITELTPTEIRIEYEDTTLWFSRFSEEMNDFPGPSCYLNYLIGEQEYRIISRKEKLLKINEI